jgi:hypothetical protein
MDDSIAYFHLRCVGHLFRFFGRELTCPKFTNVKGFLLSMVGMEATSYLIKNGIYAWIPGFAIGLNGLWWFSSVAFVCETYGIVTRLVHHYNIFFSCIEFDPYRYRCKCNNHFD